MRSVFFLFSLFFILSPAVYVVYSQSGGLNPYKNTVNINRPSIFQNQQRIRDSLYLWQERIQLHTDKSIFSPKEFLFFRADILTGPDQFRVSASKVLKVELLNRSGELLVSQVHKITNGVSHGSLEIPKKIESGRYYLRAYTRWMLNYSPEVLPTMEILITKKRDKISQEKQTRLIVRPESGFLVDQLTTQVAVYHKDESLHQKPVVDSQGNIVTRINEFDKGTGRFLFTPSKGDEYYIRVENDLLVQLPKVQEKGYTIRLNNLNQDKALIRIEASARLMGIPVYLKGVSNETTIFESKIAFQNSTWEQVEIPKAELPEGILELRLEDASGQVWANRPMRIEQNELQITVERKTHSDGKEVFRIQVVDESGIPVATELSVSLLEEINTNFSGKSVRQEVDEDIFSRNKRFIDDLLVLTGQYTDKQGILVTKQIPDEIRYSFQKGLEFYGQAYDLNNTMLENTDIQMLISTEEKVIAIETRTNSNGMFKITGMQIEGEANIVFRTAGEETEEKLVKVVPYEYEIPPLKLQKDIWANSVTSEQVDPDLPQRSEQEFDLDLNSEKLIALEEVTLVATRELHKTSLNRYDLKATRVIEQDIERPKTLPQLFLNIPGVQVVGLGTLSPSIFIPRASFLGPLLWVIDGFPLNQTTRFVDVINLVSFIDVERIELLIGSEASIYGSRAAGGVIQIYTRSGSDIEYLARKDAEVQYEGFHQSVSFEEYKNSRKRNKISEGIPNTMYWDPKLQTDKNGEAVIRLFSPITDTPVSVVVKAITENGLKGNAVTFF